MLWTASWAGWPTRPASSSGCSTARRGQPSAVRERKLIERAKGLLMRARGLSEMEAYALLRRTAMGQNRKIVEIAQSLVTAASLLDPGGDT